MNDRAVMFNRKVLWWMGHGVLDLIPRMRLRCWRITDPGLAGRIAETIRGAS